MNKRELTVITQELSGLIADMRDENNFPPDIWGETKQAAIQLRYILENEMGQSHISFSRIQRKVNAHKDAQLMSFVANMLDWSI